MDTSVSHHKELYNKLAAQVEGWMTTYDMPPFDGSGGIGGPLATFWASSPYVAGPYLMNAYGMIRGLCARAKDDPTSAARLRVENLCLYYLRSQDPTSGVFICATGEDPLSGYGLVQQLSVVAALWEVHRLWPHRDLARAADRCWQACVHDPGQNYLWTVANQALRGCEALILGIQARGEANPTPGERTFLDSVGRTVRESQWPSHSPLGGAISQALHNDYIIMPYQGKCLTPLVMMAQALRDERYLDMARRLADFIHTNMAGGGPGLIKGQYPPRFKDPEKVRWLYRSRYLFPFLERSLRTYRRSNLTGWQHNPWPQWIARGFDTARGFYHLGRALQDSHYVEIGLGMVREAMNFQSPLGGFRNTLGFFGEDPDQSGGWVWQDATPIPRWNSYAVQFLHELAAGENYLEPIKPSPGTRDRVRLADGRVLLETDTELSLIDAEARPIWKLRKGFRWGKPFRPIAQWNEGAVVMGRRVSY